jgi:hypothetical protein
VETKRLNEQANMNLARFPEDFRFQLTRKEYDNLRSENPTSSWGGRRSRPWVFTEYGVIAAAGVLKSEHAAAVSVQVARAFVAMRDQLAALDSHPVLVEVAKRLAKLEKHSAQQTDFNQRVLDALRNADSFIELVEGQITEAP